MKKHLIALSCLVLSTAVNSAEKDHDHGHEKHDKHEKTKHAAHEHGIATMNLARLGKEVQIELTTPSFNLLGFEHEPNSDEQKATVSNAEKVLKNPSKLFTFDGSKCEVEHVSVKDPFEHDDHHEHEHKEKKESDHAHKHDSEEVKADESTHSEYTLVYHFECESSEGVLNMNASTLFSKFPNFSKIRTQWLSDNKEGSIELTPSNSQLSIN